MSFTIEELELKNNSEEEQVRTRKIFEALKIRALNNEPMTEHEKTFFCMGVQLSTWNDGKIDDYPCCDNYKFTGLFLVYFRDLTGGSIYFKPQKDRTFYKVSAQEAQDDLNYLINKAKEWETVIIKTNHSESALNISSKETRNDIKTLEELPIFKNDPFSRGKFQFLYKKWAILLSAKYIYCMTLEVIETFGSNDYILELNGKKIHITDYSIIHITSRHFAQIVKQFDNGKSYHKEDFMPRLLNKQLENIFNLIERSQAYKGQSIDNINFKYRDVDYQIWTRTCIRQEKGTGNVNYIRLETFYPINDQPTLDNLLTNYQLININSELAIYLKNNGS